MKRIRFYELSVLFIVISIFALFMGFTSSYSVDGIEPMWDRDTSYSVTMFGTMFFLLGIIFAIIGYFFIKPDKKNEQSKQDSSLTILNERYAKGEITKKEFDEMKKDIE